MAAAKVTGKYSRREPPERPGKGTEEFVHFLSLQPSNGGLRVGVGRWGQVLPYSTLSQLDGSRDDL